MKSHTNAVELLRAIQQTPGMYFGTSERPFSLLLAFLTDVDIGCHIGRGEVRDLNLVPEGFHQFVTERIGRPYPDGGRGWMTFVRESSKSEEEAFELFIRLREEFDHARKPVPPNQPPTRPEHSRRARCRSFR